MSNVSIYLNFMGNAEEAFNYYKKVFKSDFSAPILRMKDIPTQPGMPQLSDAELNKVMHVALPILGGTEIMATDLLESMGHQLIVGNNITISLNPDTKQEADRLYNELAMDGTKNVPPHDEFWGYWGTCKDQFGTQWMFNVSIPTYKK
ncbi:VOC family protein [Flavobacterium cellulosilyticum]|uniref:VOC family protein n=1 Tax=Flavobacterium cellulosilyticum TaxID=2541731 RepID=A0A4R5CAQ3_9FLAO|nr:VOC family protein [Flavobacterium cellulosilyticum]TDD97008.1 VOC family protein [Flavobacterium cellulosilyticum]